MCAGWVVRWIVGPEPVGVLPVVDCCAAEPGGDVVLEGDDVLDGDVALWVLEEVAVPDAAAVPCVAPAAARPMPTEAAAAIAPARKTTRLVPWLLPGVDVMPLGSDARLSAAAGVAVHRLWAPAPVVGRRAAG